MIKIYKIFVNVIFVIIIALLAIYLVFRVTDKVEIYRVKTGSMEEKIHVGDYIMIYRKSDYNVGEIVTYTSNDGFITHRIIKKDGNKFVTKGDANNAEDREIVASTIVGEAILIGGILNVVINYKYVIVCILISLYLFSCYFGDGKKKETESKKDEVEKEEGIIESSKEIENAIEKKEEIIEENKTAIDTEIKEHEDEMKIEEEITESSKEIEGANEKKEEIIEESKIPNDTEIKEHEDEIRTEEVKEENQESEKNETKEEIAKEDIEKVEDTLIMKKKEKKK